MRLENFWIFTKSDKVHTGFLRSSSTNTIIPFRLLCKLKAVGVLNGRDINKVLLPELTASVSPRMAIVLCRSDVFLRKQKTRVHILTRMSKYEQGGSWNNNAKNCVVGKRNNNNPDNSNDNLGFRLVLRP